MADYISREAALEIVKRTSGDYAAAFSEIRKLPTTNVEPVRQHGRWRGYTHSRYYGCDEDGEPIYRDGVVYFCSNRKCGRQTVIKEKYCPSCGNIMDLEGENDE